MICESPLGCCDVVCAWFQACRFSRVLQGYRVVEGQGSEDFLVDFDSGDFGRQGIRVPDFGFLMVWNYCRGVEVCGDLERFL